MDISVGDFAEQILRESRKEAVETPPPTTPPTMNPTSSFYSSNVTQQAPDVSKVEVPNDFVNMIYEDTGREDVVPLEEAEVVAEPVKEVQTLDEGAELKLLIQELRELLVDVKQTLVEMTAVGSLGVNMAGATPDPMKKEEDKAKKDLERLLKKIRQGAKK
jgi:hypothetical protein